jgi:predicted permease
MTNGILYKSLPVRDPQELRLVTWTCDAIHNAHEMRELEWGYSLSKSGNQYNGCFPYFAYLDFAREIQGFSDLFAFSHGGHAVTINAGGVPFSAEAQMVSGNFFRGYGAPVLIGRPIAPEDDRPGAAPVAVLTYPLWQRVFGLDPQALGQTLTVGETGFTVIGVLPRPYVGPTAGETRTDFYVPLTAQKRLMPRERWLERDNAWWVSVMGRLAPGADEIQMQTSLSLLFRQVVDRAGALMDQPGISLQKGRQGVRTRERSEWGGISWCLQSVVGLVLLIACTNLAGLLLARGAVRQQEMAVRAALGAGRCRLIRQSLTESLLLSLGGVCLGLVFSLWVRGIVSGFILDPSSQRHFDLRMDTHVLLFALTVGVVTTFFAGLFPALRAGVTDPSAGLKEAGSRGAPRLHLGKMLVTAQMGMSVLFVVVGGLLCRTLINLYRVDPGYDTENLLLVPVDPGKSLSPPKDEQFFLEAVRQKIAGIPGVRHVAFSNTTLTSGGWTPDLLIPSRPEQRSHEAMGLSVSEGYFATMGINLLHGRDFLATDTDKSEDVVIVNEEFARVFFAGKNPLGQFIALRISADQSEEYQIVGLCSNHKCGSLRQGISPIFYRPYSQYRTAGMVCLVRSVLPPLSLVPAVRRAVADLDGSLLLEGITTQKLALKESLRPERLLTSLFGSFALLALALCCVGLYGLMAYNVARRTREMGIRKALGARPRDVAWPVLRESLILAALGVAIGLPVALALVRVARSFLYGIEPHDPATMVGTVGIMVTVAVLAAWIPARRAARIDPMVALRYE